MKQAVRFFAVQAIAIATAMSSLATPVVTITEVRQDYPNGNTVKVKYTVADGVSDDSYAVKFYATINSKVSEVTVTPAEATPVTTLLSTGSHEVTWEADANLLDAEAGFAAKVVAKMYDAATYAGQPYMVVDLETGSVAYEGGALENYNTPVYKTTKMVFRRVHAGQYWCTTGAVYNVETPNAIATMDKDYYIAIFECTEAQFNTIIGSGAKTSMKPKSNISWDDIRDSVDSTNSVPSTGNSVVAKLNKKTNLYFDLPTDTMWQVAAHASGFPGDARFYGKDDYRLSLYCNRSGNDVSNLKDVGSCFPNQWGIYDMYGNVWEWCLDACVKIKNNAEDQTMTQTPQGVGDARVIRGGSAYMDDLPWFRSGSRNYREPAHQHWTHGFRLAYIVQ